MPTTVITVSNQSDLNAAISRIDGSPAGSYEIDLANDVLPFNTPALTLGAGVSLAFDGPGRLPDSVTEPDNPGSLGTVSLLGPGATLDISDLADPVTIGSLSGVAGTAVLLGSNRLTVNATSSTTYAGVISGAGGLTKDGDYNTTLTGANTYTGATNIVAGQLAIVGSGSIADSSGVSLVIPYDGIWAPSFDISGATAPVSVNSLDGDAPSYVQLGAGTLTVQDAGTEIFGGTLSGTGSLVTTGPGTLKLSTVGSDIATGPVTIASGTLQIGGDGEGSNGLIELPGAISDNGTLVLDNDETTYLSGAISGSGAVIDEGFPLLRLSGANSFSGGLTLASGEGTLELTSGAAAGTGQITFATAANQRVEPTLRIDAGQPAGALAGLVARDTIDFASIVAGQVSQAGNVVTVSGSRSSATLVLAPGTDEHGEGFVASSDGAGGTEITLATLPDTTRLTGSAAQYTVTPTGAGDGSLTVQDDVAARNGTQVSPASNVLSFTDGVGLPDPTGLVGEVARLYQAAFDRTPDLAGVQYWAGQAEANVPLDAIAGAFTTSPEFVADYGALGTDAFVRQLYQNVLHRPGEGSGIAYWDADLNAGASRGQVLDAFAQSDENKAGTIGMAGDPNNAETLRLYQAAFARAPDQAGLDYWSGQLAAGATPVQVAAGFTSSAEFQSDYAGLDAQGIVEKLYQDVLGRAGEPSGISYWTGQLQNGASQAQVLQGFADSAENRTNTAAATHDGWVLIGS